MPAPFSAPDEIDVQQALQHQHAWQGTLKEMLDVAAAAHIREGYSKEEAYRLAAQATIAWAFYMGGRMFYLPTGDAIRRAARDEVIAQTFNGRNGQELSRLYRITIQRIYQIVDCQRELHFRRSQLDLFESAEEPPPINQTL